MRQILAAVCLGTIAALNGGCALWQGGANESRVHVQQPLVMNPQNGQLGAGDPLGRAIFDHYVAIARARGLQPPHVAGAERVDSIQP